MAPVTLAVRVPPSASSTSQSMVIVRSPRALRSTADRSARPMSRAISCDLPPRGLPLNPSRDWRFVPELRYISDYHVEPDYVAALAASVRAQAGRL